MAASICWLTRTACAPEEVAALAPSPQHDIDPGLPGRIPSGQQVFEFGLGGRPIDGCTDSSGGGSFAKALLFFLQPVALLEGIVGWAGRPVHNPTHLSQDSIDVVRLHRARLTPENPGRDQPSMNCSSSVEPSRASVADSPTVMATMSK